MKEHANIDRARAAWASAKGGVPEWVFELAQACDRGSQGRVADRLGISAAVVNQVLGNAYKGRLDRVEQRVRGELMKETVNCPVLGPLSRRDCLDYQRRRFSSANHLLVKMRRTCPTCPNREDACSSRD